MELNRFGHFIGYLLSDSESSEVAAKLQKEGANLRRVFSELQVYAEGRSIAADRKKRGKQFRAIVNRGVRNDGVSPEVGRWLLNRSELAHATNGLGRVHNTDSLAGLHIYLELVTGRRVSMRELSCLVGATNHALGIKPIIVDSETIGHELRRHRQKNASFLKILEEDIARNL